MSAAKTAVMGSDSVQYSEVEILKLVSESLNFKFRERVQQSSNNKSYVNSAQIEDFKTDDRSQVTMASY